MRARDSAGFTERFRDRFHVTLQPSGLELDVEQTDGESRDGETHQSAVWAAGAATAHALQDPHIFPPCVWEHKRHALELGAGCGVVGITAALLGCQHHRRYV